MKKIKLISFAFLLISINVFSKRWNNANMYGPERKLPKTTQYANFKTFDIYGYSKAADKSFFDGRYYSEIAGLK